MNSRPEDILRLLRRDSLTQPKVLLVEDSDADAAYIGRLIQQYYPMTLIEYAKTKEAALAFLNAGQYDVIIVDLMLPDSTGHDDLQNYKDAAEETPIIVLTGHYSDEAVHAAQRSGITGILQKDKLSEGNFEVAIENAANNIFYT